MRKLEHFHFHREPFVIEHRKKTSGSLVGFYHCHQPGEWLLVFSGEGYVVVRDRRYELLPGRLFFFQPYQIHRIHVQAGEVPSPEGTGASGSGQPYIRTILHFDRPLTEQHLEPFPGIQTFFRTLCQRELQEQVLDVTEKLPFLDAVFGEYMSQRERVRNADRRELDTLLLSNLLTVLKDLFTAGQGAEGQTFGEPRTLRYAEAIMDWIERRFSEEFKLDELAQDLHLSKSYVSRVFRRETGESITGYISARRMREACILLVSTGLSVERIALQVGYRDFSYFSQAFKASFGVTPTQYRQMH